MPENEVDLSRVEQAVKVLNWVKAERKRLDDMESAAKSEVQEALGENENGVIGDRRVVTWRHGSQRRLDMKKLKADLPQVYDAYTKEVPTRTFLLAEED